MITRDEIAAANQRLWEEEVKRGCGYTVPWLDLDVDLLQRYAGGELASLPEPLDCLSPPSILAGVARKDVLCLASGGGQQSAVFGLLSARVTVVDLAEGQLRCDRRAAEHYGYEVTTLHADMRDLSALDDEAFDLVYQAPSLCYVPSVREVYAEVSRVLRSGGRYRAEYHQPVTQFVAWDGEGYRITEPYSERVQRREDGGIEFRHYMDDIFGGLVEAGLSLRQVVDKGRHREPDLEAPPGSWEHQDSYVGGGFVIVAVKDRDLSSL
jgi:SAM-dependent methyltransferase